MEDIKFTFTELVRIHKAATSEIEVLQSSSLKIKTAEERKLYLGYISDYREIKEKCEKVIFAKK